MLDPRRNGLVKVYLLALATSLLVVGVMGMGHAQPGTPAPAPADPAETIRQMEEQRKKENPPASPVQPGTSRPVEQTYDTPTTGTRLIRENTFMTQRRGRMTRSLTGEWVFTFDADAKGKSEPAMVLMPCMNLQNMEKIVERSGEGTNFTLSGTIYVYKGRNYILPSMYIVNRRGELAPAQ